MTYQPSILVSDTNVIPAVGSSLYGIAVAPATFDPPCDGYDFVPGTKTGEIFFNAFSVLDLKGGRPSIGTRFTPLGGREESPYSLDL